MTLKARYDKNNYLEDVMSNIYYVAKLNINGNIFTDDKNFNKIKTKLIPNKILSFKNGNSKNYITQKKEKYTFADIEKLDKDIIFGKIVKLFDRELENVNEGKTLKKWEQDGKECKFFYSIENELFLLQKCSLYQGGNELLNIIENLIETDYNIGELKIKLLKASQDIRKILINDKIKEIQFNYIHPNDKTTLDQFSEAMNSIEASTGNMNWKAAKEKTLVLADKYGNAKPITQDMLKYTNNGYGDIIATKDDGSKIKSNDPKYTLQETLPDKNRISLSKIKQVFNKIKTHMKGYNDD